MRCGLGGNGRLSGFLPRGQYQDLGYRKDDGDTRLPVPGTVVRIPVCVSITVRHRTLRNCLGCSVFSKFPTRFSNRLLEENANELENEYLEPIPKPIRSLVINADNANLGGFGMTSSVAWSEYSGYPFRVDLESCEMNLMSL